MIRVVNNLLHLCVNKAHFGAYWPSFGSFQGFNRNIAEQGLVLWTSTDSDKISTHKEVSRKLVNLTYSTSITELS